MDDLRSASATADAGTVIAVGTIGQRGHSNPRVGGWFTEGCDTRDLKEAKASLDELASELLPRGWS